jgi:hypothetical protein
MVNLLLAALKGKELTPVEEPRTEVTGGKA